MFCKITILSIIFVITASAADECGECMPNLALCVNNTSYKLCTADTAVSTPTLSPVDDEIYKCNPGEYCTNSINVCETNPDGTAIIAVCNQASSGSCSTCKGKSNGVLICLSATQFAICRGSGVSSNPLSCPVGQLCSEDLLKDNLKRVCAPQSVLDYLEAKQTCNFEGTVTPPTTTISPASSTLPMTTDELETECTTNAHQTGAYFKTEHPYDCRKYVYCQRKGNEYEALEMKCKSGQFYSVAKSDCIQATRCPNSE